MLVSGTLLNIVADFIGPQLALTGGCVIVLAYVWSFVAWSPAMRQLSLAKAGSPAGRAE